MLPRKQAIGMPGALRGDTTAEPMYAFLWMAQGEVLRAKETLLLLYYNGIGVQPDLGPHGKQLLLRSHRVSWRLLPV